MDIEEAQQRIAQIQEEIKTASPEHHDSLVNELLEIVSNLEKSLYDTNLENDNDE